MNCREADQLIQRSLDQSLDGADRALLDGHLDGCEGCRASWRQYRRLAAATRHWIENGASDPGPSFTESVMSAISRAPAARLAGSRAAIGWAFAGCAAMAAAAWLALPHETLTSIWHSGWSLPTASSVAANNLHALRSLSETVSRPPALPVSPLLWGITFGAAAAVNIVMAQRAARRSRRGLA